MKVTSICRLFKTTYYNGYNGSYLLLLGKRKLQRFNISC